MQDLALQIGEVNLIAVGEGNVAQAGGGEIEGGRRAQAAGTDNQRLGVDQALLSFDADLVEQDVAAIAKQLLVVHRAGPGLFLQMRRMF
jgi:hypothetical protein